jgi:ABC-type uncharacterized transport system substrate-binding protein
MFRVGIPKKYFLFVFLFVFFSLEIFPATVGILYDEKIPIYKNIVTNFMTDIQADGTKVKTIEFVRTDDKADKAAMCKNIKASGVNFIFCVGLPASEAASESGVPGVFTMVVDAVKAGLITKDGMPRGNMTGVLVNVSPKAQFSYLKDIMGTKTRAGVIYQPAVSAFIVTEYTKSSSDFGFQICEVPVSSKEEVAPEVEKLKGKVDFILSVVDNVVYNAQCVEFILRFSINNKIPLVGFSPNQAKAGALISFYCDYPKLGNQSARLMSKILKSNGGDVSMIPVELPNDVNYAINTNIAKLFKIEIPASVKSGAAETYGG